MKEVWYKLITITEDGKEVPINISDIHHMIGVTLGLTEVHMDRRTAYALRDYVLEFFNVFNSLILVRMETVYNEETDETDVKVYNVWSKNQ